MEMEAATQSWKVQIKQTDKEETRTTTKKATSQMKMEAAMQAAKALVKQAGKDPISQLTHRLASRPPQMGKANLAMRQADMIRQAMKQPRSVQRMRSMLLEFKQLRALKL